MPATTEDLIQELRQQLLDRCSFSDAVSNGAHWLQATALARRYEVCELDLRHLENFNAHELLSLIYYAPGPCLQPVVRQAWRQAVIETDAAGLSILRRFGGLDDCWQHLEHIGNWDVATATAQLPQSDALQRLLICRRFPELAQVDWLLASSLPADAADLALLPILTKRPECHQDLVSLLSSRPDLLCSHDPEELLEDLIRHCDQDPATLLQPLTFAWNDRTRLRLAAWYLRHGQHDTVATHLVAIHDDAGLQPDLSLIIGMHALHTGDAEQALAHYALLPDGPHRRHLLALLAKAGIDADTPLLVDSARACGAAEDETFFMLIQCLLGRRALQEARSLAREMGPRFSDSEAVQRLVQVLVQ